MATIVVYGDNSDNHGASGNWVANYPNARNMQSPAIAAVNSWEFSDFGNCPPGQRYVSGGNHYGCGQAFLAFDTGGIVDPTAATLTMVHAAGASNLAHRMELLVYNWGPTVTTASLRTGDQLTSLQNVGFFDFDGVAGTFTGCVFSGSTSLHNYLNHSGFSYFILASANQRNNVTPTGNEWTQWYAANDQTGYRPYLTITSGDRQAYLVIAAGTTTFTPVMLGDHDVELWGAGGRTATGTAQGAGSGGGAFSLAVVTVASLSAITVQVGAANTTNGTAGQDSWFKSASSPDPLAKGGLSGGRAASAAGGAGGAAASGRGTVKWNGGAGAAAQSGGGSRAGSGGGSGGYTTAAGAVGSVGASAAAGAGAVSSDPNAGSGGIGGAVSGAGGAGVVPGGGGGGGGSSSGANGNGAAGRIVVYWLAGYTASAAGTSTMVAAGASTVARTASAAGTTPTAVAVGRAITDVVGSADGTSAALAVGDTIIAADGSAIGTSDSLGVGSYTITVSSTATAAGTTPTFRALGVAHNAGFPIIQGWATSLTSGGTDLVLLPGGILKDELILVTVSSIYPDASLTKPPGFTLVTTVGTATVVFYQHTYYKIADGTEGGTNVAFGGMGDNWRSVAFRIANHDSVAFPPQGAGSWFNTGAPNPPNLTPSGGARKYAWLEICTTLGSINATAWASAGFTSLIRYGTLAAGLLESEVASVDPGNMVAANQFWTSHTLAIYPGELPSSTVIVEGAGTASGASAVSATGATILEGAGSAAGASVVLATGTAITARTVTAAGTTSAVSGVGRSTAAGTGSTVGTSTVQAASVTILARAGSAAGVGDALGTGASLVTAVGNSIGTGVAAGVPSGITILAATGSADGTSVVSAYSSFTAIIEAVGTVTIGAAGPFTPDSITGLLLWIDIADSGMILSSDYTPISDGATVQAVFNKLGGGGAFTQANTAKRPYYKISPLGKPGLYRAPFTGGDRWLTGGTGAQYDVRNMTVFAALDLSELPAASSSDPVYPITRIDWDWWDGWYISANWVYPDFASARVDFYQVDEANSYIESRAQAVRALTPPRPLVIVGRRDDTTISAGVTGSTLTTVAANAYVTPIGPHQIIVMGMGGHPADPVTGPYGGLTGYLHEVLHYDGALSDADRQAVEGYLAWKWDVEADLPVGHPHKDAAPAGIGGVGVFATGAATAAATGSAAGSSVVNGVGAFTTFVAGTGNAAGTGAANGASRFLATFPAAGSSAGTGSASAIGRAITGRAGTAAGASSVSGVGASIRAGIGNASGVATAAAGGALLREVIGSSAGIATVQGDGTAVAFGVATASGTAEATGVIEWKMTVFPTGLAAVGMVGGASVLWGGIDQPPDGGEVWTPKVPDVTSSWVPVVPPGTEIWRPVVT